jgi:hypothetical protein
MVALTPFAGWAVVYVTALILILFVIFNDDKF